MHKATWRKPNLIINTALDDNQAAESLSNGGTPALHLSSETKPLKETSPVVRFNI